MSRNAGTRAERPRARVDTVVEDAFWRINFPSRPYVAPGETYGTFRPAFRLGWEAWQRFAGRSFEEIEDWLASQWASSAGKVRGLDWDRARLAARDAWSRLERASFPGA